MKRTSDQIQNLKQQITALEAERARLLLENAMIDAIGDGILVVNDDGAIIRVNDCLIDMWELDEDAGSLTTLETLRDEIIQKIDRERTKQAIPQILTPHNHQDNLEDLVLIDGRIFEQYAGVKHYEGSVVGYVWSFRDVTARRKTEQELYLNQEFVHRLMSNMGIILFTLNTKGVVTYSRGAGLSRLGYQQGQLVGVNMFDEFNGHPVLNDIRMALNGKRVRNTHDFESIFHDVYMGPMHNEAKELIGVIGVSVDVTDQKRAREALQMARELREAKQLADQLRVKAEDANLAKSTFLANMSHELRTPLNSIIGFSQFLVNDISLDAEQLKYMRLIMTSSEHLLTLINDILEMSKIESGKIQLQLVDFDLIELLETLDSIYRANAANSGLDFIVTVDDDLPRYLHGDRSKIRQILVNLLSNAIKFTDVGSIALRAKLVSSTNDGSHLIFEVEDTGSGIASHELDMLFEPFMQTSSGHNTNSGTGLGLPISREFAELMDGSIRVESEEGVGSCFCFELSLPEAVNTVVAVDNKGKHIQHLAPGQDVPKILVVDDKWENRLMLVRMLQRAGLDVEEASDGRQSLEKYARWNPDLIWMDMRMPHMDGYEATSAIRSQKGGDDVVIVALTASAFDHERDRVLAAGCDDFLAKPFREFDLFQVMQKHLDLEFVYADENPLEDTVRSETTNLLAEIPKDLLEQLHQASKRLSLKEVKACIKAIKQYDPKAAEAVKKMAEEFDFNSIIMEIEATL